MKMKWRMKNMNISLRKWTPEIILLEDEVDDKI